MCNPDCPCLDDTDDDEDLELMRRRRKKKKKSHIPKTSCRPYSPGPPDAPKPDQPLPIYKKALRQIEKESLSKPAPTQPKIKSCLMFSSSSQSYKESFPSLERHRAFMALEFRDIFLLSDAFHSLEGFVISSPFLLFFRMKGPLRTISHIS